jgi:hypothetical protein
MSTLLIQDRDIRTGDPSEPEDVLQAAPTDETVR